MFRIVLVEPFYAGNIGSVARVMKNFDFRELYLVAPRVHHLSDEALTWAVHAKDILESARVVSRLEDAIEDCVSVVATTAKPNEKSTERTPITPRQFARLFRSYWHSDDCVAILFGREPSGLTNEEIALADVTVTIPTSPQYPAMNISHAAAVILYELYVARGRRVLGRPVKKETMDILQRFTRQLVYLSERDRPNSVLRVFRSVFRRGLRTDREARAIIGVFADIIRRCGGGGGKGDQEGV